MSRRTRRIGLGVMGWSDLLIQMGVRYDSVEALELAREVMKFIQDETYRASCELAKSRGPFPEWGQQRLQLRPRLHPHAQLGAGDHRAHGNDQHHRGGLQRD